MWPKLFFLFVTFLNVKAVDNVVDPESHRLFEIQRGPNGEVTGVIEIPDLEKLLPILNRRQEEELLKPLLANTETMLTMIPEQQQPSPLELPLLVENNNDFISLLNDVVKVDILNKRPPENQSNKDNIIQETEIAAEQPEITLNQNVVITAEQPEPAPNQVIVIPAQQPEPVSDQIVIIPAEQPVPVHNQVVVIPAEHPEPAPNQVIVIPAQQPEPVSDQIVIIPAEQQEPVHNQVVVIPAEQPEPAPNQVIVIPAQQPEPVSDQIVIIPAKQPEPVHNQVAVIPAEQPEPAPNQVKVIPAEQPEPASNQVVVIGESDPEPKPVMNVMAGSPRLTRECPSLYGLYALQDNECSNYFACQAGIATLMTCPKGLVFNPTVEACDWLENVPSCRPRVFFGVACPSFRNGDEDFVAKYRYGESCTEYIACHRGAPRLLKCDAGLAFDEYLQHCVAADRVQRCS